ncbi:MAG: hypothetical protein ACI88A_000981 [Paraglaciecola sp.]|jgi:hypothetical protein
MAKLVALNSKAHKMLRVNTEKIAEHGADLHMIPVVVSEFLKLVVQFPILFSKSVETGHFVCVALMGFEEGENLFWQNAQFNSIYTPLNIARQPFFVGQDEYSGDDYVICIDLQSHALSELPTEDKQELLFDQQGAASAYLQSAQSILAELINGEQQTAQFIQILLTHNLLLPLSLDITFEDEQSCTVNGLYSVDEDKLASLDGSVLSELNASGWLQPIYTQLASLGQIYALIDKKNRRNAQPSPWFKVQGE